MELWLHSLAVSDVGLVDGFRLDRVQTLFAGGPPSAALQALKHSTYPETNHAFAIMLARTAVGFFILKEGPALPEWANKDAITLHNFSISSQFHRKGYGLAGIGLAARWISENRPQARVIELAVNSGNKAALALYLKCGFVDTGKRARGSFGELIILAHAIGDPSSTHARTRR